MPFPIVITYIFVLLNGKKLEKPSKWDFLCDLQDLEFHNLIFEGELAVLLSSL